MLGGSEPAIDSSSPWSSARSALSVGRSDRGFGGTVGSAPRFSVAGFFIGTSWFQINCPAEARFQVFGPGRGRPARFPIPDRAAPHIAPTPRPPARCLGSVRPMHTRRSLHADECACGSCGLSRFRYRDQTAGGHRGGGLISSSSGGERFLGLEPSST